MSRFSMATNAVVRVHHYGGAECLTPDELPLELLRDGQLLIEVEAAGVNFFDTHRRGCLYKQPLPLAPGNEGAGVVREVGAGVTSFKPRDRLAWVQSTGSYARWKVIAAEQVFALPADLSCEAAVTVLFQGMTAHRLTCSTYPLAADETCIVHSAAGGVGLLLTRIAEMRGATVIGAVSTGAKAEVAATNGCDHVFVYGKGKLSDLAKRVTSGRGVVDIAYDAAGKDLRAEPCQSAPAQLACAVRRSERARAAHRRPAVLMAGSVYLTRTGLNAHAATPEERRQRAATTS